MTASSQPSRKKAVRQERANSAAKKPRDEAPSAATPQENGAGRRADPKGRPAHPHLNVWPD